MKACLQPSVILVYLMFAHLSIETQGLLNQHKFPFEFKDLHKDGVFRGFPILIRRGEDVGYNLMEYMMYDGPLSASATLQRMMKKLFKLRKKDSLD